jgi:hypothetical protein
MRAQFEPSLLTRDEDEARRLLQARNDAVNQPLMNLVMAKTYLAVLGPKLITRTWADGPEHWNHSAMAEWRIGYRTGASGYNWIFRLRLGAKWV